jgi:hypothetical protein
MNVIKRLIKLGITNTTIHDAVLVPESKADVCKQVMVEEYVKLFGFKPVVKVK